MLVFIFFIFAPWPFFNKSNFSQKTFSEHDSFICSPFCVFLLPQKCLMAYIVKMSGRVFNLNLFGFSCSM